MLMFHPTKTLFNHLSSAAASCLPTLNAETQSLAVRKEPIVVIAINKRDDLLICFL